MIDRTDNPDSFSSSDSDMIESDTASDTENISDLQTVCSPSSDLSAANIPLPTAPSQESGRKYMEISDNMTESHPEKEKSATKQLQDLVNDTTRTGTIDHNMIDVKDIVENVIQETRLLGNGDDLNEPDIVRSTKTRTPPNTLQNAVSTSMDVTPSEEVKYVVSEVKVTDLDTFTEPKPPPRRKKKLQVTVDQTNLNTRVQRFLKLQLLLSKLFSC